MEKQDLSAPLATPAVQEQPSSRTVHGYRKLVTSEELSGTTFKPPFKDEDSCDLGRTYAQRVGYLEGLRGLLAFQVMLWSFFRIFAPAIATDTDIDGTRPAAFVASSPEWHSILRKAASPLLWDGGLQGAFFMILSARVVALTFIERRNSISLAGAVFRRAVRLTIPVAFTLAIVLILNVTGSFHHASALAADLSNPIAEPPARWSSVLQYINALTAYFFDNSGALTSVPAVFIPLSGIIACLTRCFIQSYSVYTFVVLLPYTRTQPKFAFGAALTVWAWWVNSWAWYSLTGMLLAEAVVVYDFPALAATPILQKWRRVQMWLPFALSLILGITLKYLWAAAFPDRRDDELVAHVDRKTGYFLVDPQPSEILRPRLDDYFVATGILGLIELSTKARFVLDNRVLKSLGRISFPLYLLSGSIFMSLGSFLWQHFTSQGYASHGAALLAILFFACTPVALAGAAVFHFLVEGPTLLLARKGFAWLIEE